MRSGGIETAPRLVTWRQFCHLLRIVISFRRLERLKQLAARDNRSLNNYVETILMDVAYNTTNATTRAAMAEAQNDEKFQNRNSLRLSVGFGRQEEQTVLRSPSYAIRQTRRATAGYSSLCRRTCGS